MASREFTSFQQALEAARQKSGAMDRLLAEAERLEIDIHAQPRYQCMTCCDRGVVSYEVAPDDARFGKLYPCPEPTCPTRNANLQAQHSKLLEKAAIPSKYAHYTFETWDDAARHRTLDDNTVLDTARAWVTSPGHMLVMAGEYLDGSSRDVTRNGLIFAGDYGTGKTGLMIAMAHALVSQGEQPLYIRAMDYIDLKYKTYRPYREGESERNDAAIEAVQKAPILMIDDFNVQNGTDNKMDVMEDLIRYRHGRELPILITCNYTIPQLTALWGERSMSALLEACHWIPFTGKPLRDTRQLGGAK